MGALLESGLVGNIGLKHLKVIKEDTINKWDKLGFLDGLERSLERKRGSIVRKPSVSLNQRSSKRF